MFTFHSLRRTSSRPFHAHGFSAGLPRVPTRAADVHQPSESTPSSFVFGVCLPRPTKIKTPQAASKALGFRRLMLP
jgi:hypothetical protein